MCLTSKILVTFLLVEFPLLGLLRSLLPMVPRDFCEAVVLVFLTLPIYFNIFEIKFSFPWDSINLCEDDRNASGMITAFSESSSLGQEESFDSQT